jgi:two-component system KDP operon response regulator KdpE
VDFAARTVTAQDGGSEPAHLTPTEWRLLEILVRNPGKLVSQRELLNAVWGPGYTRESSYLRV